MIVRVGRHQAGAAIPPGDRQGFSSHIGCNEDCQVSLAMEAYDDSGVGDCDI